LRNPFPSIKQGGRSMGVEAVTPLSLEEQIVLQIPALRSFARTLSRAPSDADDLVQESLLKALANKSHFHEGTRLKSWLFTIMRNSFCSQYRLGKREVLGSLECVSSKGSVPADQEWHIRGRELELACSHLPERYRSAFEFVFIDGKSYEEAAARFHCPIGTIKSRVNRARRQLTEDLGENRSA
jgi:RNA polymerase sigma factor (sigma-70 family)